MYVKNNQIKSNQLKSGGDVRGLEGGGNLGGVGGKKKAWGE